MTTSTINIIPLSEALGAEMEGIDLSRPLDEAAQRAVREAWSKHLVLLFRDQDFSAKDQLRFARYFGPVASRKLPNDYHIPASSRETPGIAYVSNIRLEDGSHFGTLPDGEMWLHHDTCYKPNPDLATMLYSMEIPDWGGHTKWSNMCKIHDALPETVRTALAGRTVLNVYDYLLTEQPDCSPQALEKVEHAFQPAIITHPVTGRRVLFINRLMTVRIEDMEKSESDEILSTCFDLIEQPEFIYTHPWVPGNFIIWDNLATTHGRTDFPTTSNRKLRRCKVAGEMLRE